MTIDWNELDARFEGAKADPEFVSPPSASPPPSRETALDQILRLTASPKRTAEEVDQDIKAEIERVREYAEARGWDALALDRLADAMRVADAQEHALMLVSSVSIDSIHFGPRGKENLFGCPRWPVSPPPPATPEPAEHKCCALIRCHSCGALHQLALTGEAS